MLPVAAPADGPVPSPPSRRRSSTPRVPTRRKTAAGGGKTSKLPAYDAWVEAALADAMAAAPDGTVVDCETPFDESDPIGNLKSLLRRINDLPQNVDRALANVAFCEIELEIHLLLEQGPLSRDPDTWPRYCTSLDAARILIGARFPGFLIASGTRASLAHAHIGPDYEAANANDLSQDWPQNIYCFGFHAKIETPGGAHRECLALLACAIQAEIARRERLAAAQATAE